MRAEFVVFFIVLAIFLYAKLGGKIAIPGISNVGSTLRSLLLREQIATTVLFALFLITFSYTFGESWKSVFGWWWDSQMAIPLIFAVSGVILFANCEWRKRVDKTLMFLIGALIMSTFAVNAFMGWWDGGEKVSTPAIATTPAPSIPQPAIVATPEPPKPREESVEREVEREDTIIAEYGVFTPVDIPPAAKIVDFRYGRNVPEWCVMGVVHEGAPGGEKVPCSNPEGKTFRGVTKIGFASDMPGDQIVVPVKYKYIPAT